jgi:hypothetical protein
LEGCLNHDLLLHGDLGSVAVSIAPRYAVYGALGVAGVGKACALTGLVHDKDVCARFSDGVLYMTLSADGTNETAIKQLVAVGNRKQHCRTIVRVSVRCCWHHSSLVPRENVPICDGRVVIDRSVCVWIS